MRLSLPHRATDLATRNEVAVAATSRKDGVSATRLRAFQKVTRLGFAASIVTAVLLTVAPGASASFGIVPGSFIATTNQAPPPGSPAGTLGPLDTQAGDHPYSATTSFAFNPSAEAPYPDQNVKDITVNLPAGFIGDPEAVPQCPRANANSNTCPIRSQVGVASLTLAGLPYSFPVYDVVPRTGEPADFQFVAINVVVHIETRVRTGADYGVTTVSTDVSERNAVNAVSLTFWGVPADPGHDPERGQNCNPQSGCAHGGQSFTGAAVKPFLTNPTFCGPPLTTTLSADSWQNPGHFVTAATTTPTGPTGCGKLSFSPSIKFTPDGTAGSTPTGLTVNVHVPQDASLNPNGLAGSDVKDITVTLPEGVTLNPAAADGLQACSEAQIGYLPGESIPPVDLHFTSGLPAPMGAPAEPFCPDASKVGTVKIKLPILPNPLEGAVYLASQNANPFGSLIALYIVAEDPVAGVLIKLSGEVSLNPQTGQITTTVRNSPQAPFEDAAFHFFGGDRAPLATPAHCGAYTTEATFTPWSGNPPIKSQSSFEITSGPHGSPCPSPLPFIPSLAAGMTNIQAGAFSPLTTTISREDGNQDIHTVQVHMPPGLSGLLSSVKLCGEEQANAGTCGPESLIGHTIVSVGLGGDPFSVTGGQVFITGPYKGAPFGLSIVNPAKAGPFDLGKVVVRATIEVDPHTAQLAITTDSSGPYAIPHILDGIPLQIKHVNVTVDRPGFTFNPTSCSRTEITGQVNSAEGASSPVSVPFQVTNCAALKFNPTIAVTTAAKSSKANGSSLVFKISYPAGAMGHQSWFNEANFDLPKQLPARLTTIQKACLAGVFETNPAACPPASLIGHAIVHTPVLPAPLAGPVYFVSHGGAKFPDAILVLQGYGVTVDLVGETFINGKTGITSATFRNTPDVPFESIEVTIPSGPFSEFGANLPEKAHGSFCGQKLVVPTLFKAQNGLEIHQNTPVGVTGCPKAKTRAQLFAATLKACHKDKNKAKRKKCEATARKRYGPVKKKKT
jgi:hypothetical protein